MNFTAMDITLRTLTENDLPFVKDIYDYYTLHTTVVYFVHCASIDERNSRRSTLRILLFRTLQAPRSLPHLGRADPLPETGVYRKRIWKTSHTPTGRDHPPRRLQQHNGTDFGRERSQHPPVRKMRFRMLRKHPAGSGEVRQKTGFEDVSENYFRQFTSHSLKADDKNTSTQEVLFKSESTIR